MPLCNAKHMLEAARREGFGVGSFNIFNMESARAIVAAAEAEDAPVMLQVWSGFGAVGYVMRAWQLVRPR